MTHTLGPWHVRKTYSGRSIVPTYWVAPEGPEPGTPALLKLLRGNRNRVHDAQLISAAPDLLAALKAWEHWYNVDSTEQNRDDARELGLRAIAKAEGR